MTDWRQRNGSFFNALEVERNVMFLILTLIVLVAALNIISGLIMLVKDKGRGHRHPAHHGRDARRGHARLPDHRRGDRRRRHARRLPASASLVAPERRDRSGHGLNLAHPTPIFSTPSILFPAAGCRPRSIGAR